MKVLQLADGRYVARWKDPLSGRQQQQSLDTLDLRNDVQRRQWAVAKSEALASTRAVIASGGAEAERVTLADAVVEFLRGYSNAGTLGRYRGVLDWMLAWATEHGIRDVQDWTPAKIARAGDDCRQGIVERPARGGRRGTKRQTGRRRAAPTINARLTVAKVFFGWARRRGWTPYLSGDAIKDNLRAVRAPREAISYLEPTALRKLLKAALRHDADTFAMTREEHDGLRPVGSTPRHEPIAPFLMGVLLSGCRFSEIAGLVWEEVDMSEGAVRLPASRVKTCHARTIRLQETPYMIELLRALALKRRGETVFDVTRDGAEAARRRLRHYGAPAKWTWHDLRRTAGTVLTCAPGIYGGASAFLSAKRLGHSVAVAERCYTGTLTGLPAEAKTLEAAAGIEDLCDEIIAAAGGVVAAREDDAPLASVAEAR